MNRDQRYGAAIGTLASAEHVGKEGLVGACNTAAQAQQDPALKGSPPPNHAAETFAALDALHERLDHLINRAENISGRAATFANLLIGYPEGADGALPTRTVNDLPESSNFFEALRVRAGQLHTDVDLINRALGWIEQTLVRFETI